MLPSADPGRRIGGAVSRSANRDGGVHFLVSLGKWRLNPHSILVIVVVVVLPPSPSDSTELAECPTARQLSSKVHPLDEGMLTNQPSSPPRHDRLCNLACLEDENDEDDEDD